MQLSITVEQAQADSACELLSEAGAVSVTLSDAGGEAVYEPEPGTAPVWSTTRLTGLFESRGRVDAALTSLQHQLDDLSSVVVEVLEAREWSEEWRQHLQPIDCGHGLWVCPAGSEPPVTPRTVVYVTPGLAFGTGAHPTTALCLRELAALDLRSTKVVDFGCGSGILGIAALALGARSVWAVDHEPQALIAAGNNARLNGVHRRLRVLASAHGLPKDADVLLANILLNPLVNLAPEFARCLMPGGRLVLSGVLDEQVDPLWAAYDRWFDLIGVRDEQGWALVSARRSE